MFTYLLSGIFLAMYGMICGHDPSPYGWSHAICTCSTTVAIAFPFASQAELGSAGYGFLAKEAQRIGSTSWTTRLASLPSHVA